jgi:hypothetical protein
VPKAYSVQPERVLRFAEQPVWGVVVSEELTEFHKSTLSMFLDASIL